MFKIFMTTVLCTLLGSLFSFFLFLKQSHIAVYAAIMVFSCIFIPVLIATVIFQFIKHRIISNTIFKTVILRICCLLILLIVGIIIWVIADVAFSDFSWPNIKKDYETQFAGFMIIAIFVSLIMPIVDMWLDKWQRRGEVYRP